MAKHLLAGSRLAVSHLLTLMAIYARLPFHESWRPQLLQHAVEHPYAMQEACCADASGTGVILHKRIFHQLLDYFDFSSCWISISLRLPYYWLVCTCWHRRHASGPGVRALTHQSICSAFQRRCWRSYQYHWHHYRDIYWEIYHRGPDHSSFWDGCWI